MPTSAQSLPTTRPNLVLTGRFTPDQERQYRHLPFDLPAGVRQLHLRYEYSDRIPSDPHLRGGNTLDLGLFDERGTIGGGPGFRGWSGSNKLGITIAETWATPPYRPGPLNAGVWNVLLGPYKVGPNGLDYRVELWFNPNVPPEPGPPHVVHTRPRPDLPPPLEPGWLRADLHCHTLNSDGDSWPIEVLAAAAETGLDVLGITDHNSANPPIAPDDAANELPILIPGVEVTTYGGHWNIWGVDRWYDFRTPTRDAVAAVMHEALDAGGLVSVNHPKPFGPPWDYGFDLPYHAIEVWNGPWQHLNPVALAVWESHLRRGRRVVAVGGSDTHNLRADTSGPLTLPRLGHPTTWIHVTGNPSPAAIVASLQAGRAFISATPAGPQLLLSRSDQTVTIRAGDARHAALMLISDTGCVASHAIPTDDWTTELPFPPNTAYLRAQILDPYGNLLALTNPLWHDAAEHIPPLPKSGEGVRG